jgi:hypothetical protein
MPYPRLPTSGSFSSIQQHGVQTVSTSGVPASSTSRSDGTFLINSPQPTNPFDGRDLQSTLVEWEKRYEAPPTVPDSYTASAEMNDGFPGYINPTYWPGHTFHWDWNAYEQAGWNLSLPSVVVARSSGQVRLPENHVASLDMVLVYPFRDTAATIRMIRQEYDSRRGSQALTNQAAWRGFPHDINEESVLKAFLKECITSMTGELAFERRAQNLSPSDTAMLFRVMEQRVSEDVLNDVVNRVKLQPVFLS